MIKLTARCFVLVFMLLFPLWLFAQVQDVLYVYKDGHINSMWTPSGWMPDGEGIYINDNIPNAEGTCMEIGFDLSNSGNGWLGVYWLSESSWHGPGVNVYEYLDAPEGSSFKLTFSVRGQDGNEKIQCKVGGVTDGGDSVLFPASSRWLSLTTNWAKYSIDLSSKDLSNVVGGFCVVTSSARNPSRDQVLFFLDDIKIEVSP